MKCPQCRYDSPDGTVHCPVCGQTLFHDAAWPIRRAQSQRRAQLERAERANTLLSFLRAVGQSILRLGVMRYLPLIFLLAGLILIVRLVRDYRSQVSQLRRDGCLLTHSLPQGIAVLYLVGFQDSTQISSTRDGALDSPLGTVAADESGSLNVERLASPRLPHAVRVQAREWIKNQTLDGQAQMENVPIRDVSLAPGKIFLDSEGTVLSRLGMQSARLGRFLWLLSPRWPKGILQRKTQWQEQVGWEDTVGDWKFQWSGRLQWTLQDFQPCYQSVCAHLIYQADLTPALRGVPDWARGAVWSARFSGRGTGDVLYSVPEHQLIANAFAYEGDVAMPITDLSRIPIEQRVGRPVESQPGEIVLHIRNKMDVRKP